MTDLSYLSRGPHRLALRRAPGRGPVILFLPGYLSDMSGSKAAAVAAWAAGRGRACVRFDYAGCGLSEGAVEAQTLDSWLGDARAALASVDGPVVLVGSSMGGWLALVLAEERSERVAAVVGIAAAPDFTEWGFDEERRARLRAEGRLSEPSPYGGETVTTLAFWESGQRRLMLDRAIAVDAPVRLLQGQADPDVPWGTALRIAARVRSADVHCVLVKDGDHRLSRPEDVRLLLRVIEELDAS